MLIPFSTIISKYRIAPTGVFHIGASSGQEAEVYAKNGVDNMVFIEALPDVFKELQEHIRPYPAAKAICACISETDGEEVVFNISSNHGESSSMFDFDTHATAHPDVKFIGTLKLITSRADTLIKENGIDLSHYDFLNIDLQGAELLALKSMGEHLKKINFAYIEVNEKHLYKNCPLIEDIDAYLLGYGFKRAETSMTGWGWGDALYLRSL